ncbi:MAG: peptidoglycan-binding protein [Alphaproteobacteria bacterium]|nr:peptidoglycan-binding protein [Alphaproteobacteria bacterium]
MFKKILLTTVIFTGLVSLSGCNTDMQMGSSSAKTVTTGSAGPGGSSNASSTLQHCQRPMGTIALVENEIPGLAQYGLQSPVPLLRLMVQQSNCFQIVDRGQAMNNIMRERQLMSSGQLKQGSNFGGGQIVAADYSLTPNVIFSNQDAGGIGGGLAAFVPYVGGALSGGLKFKEAQTMLAITDNRSGLQIAAAEGSASKSDMSILGGLSGFGGGYGGAVGAGSYTNTAEGKVVAAAFADAYNQIVSAVKASAPAK